MLKDRVINIRVMFVTFCGLMIGILFPYLFIKNIISLIGLLVFGIVFSLLAIGLYVYAHLTSSRNLLTRYREKVSGLIKCSCIGFMIAFLTGAFLVFQPIVSVFALSDYGNSEVAVTGVVSDYVQDNSTYKKFIVSNCVIDNGTNIDSIEYKVCVYSSKFVNFKLGDLITFKGKLDRYKFSKESDFSLLTQKIGYSTFIDGSGLIVTEGDMELKDIIKNNTKKVLDNNLNEDNANISYAILFGEKQGLTDNIKDMFSYAGVSHILAVSGLHIGVLVAFLYFLLRKIKMNKWARLVILGTILLFYSYLCSFTPSVCRASIMAILLALCHNIGCEYDMLSSLSIAGIIILVFNPFALFTISFQLSFLCIFAIISLAPTLTKMFVKIKLPKFIASGLAISISTNLVILPVCFNVFTKVSLLGVLTNVFVLPIFGLTYVLLFIVVILSLIWHSLGMFLVVPNLFLHIIKTIANYVSSIEWVIFRVFNISYWILVIIMACTLILHFLMIRRFYKGGVVLVLLIVIISTFMINFIPTRYSGENLIFGLKYKSNVCYYVHDNYVTMIGSDIDSDLVLSEMKKLRLNKIDTIIAYDLQLNNMTNLLSICDEFKVDSIYIPKYLEYDELATKFKDVRFFGNNIVIGNLQLNTIVFKNQTIGVTLEIEDIGRVLIPEIKPTKLESAYILENYANIDFIYINSGNINIDLSNINAKNIICNECSELADIALEDIDIFVLNQDFKEESL